jgi:hypothetical protein
MGIRKSENFRKCGRSRFPPGLRYMELPSCWHGQKQLCDAPLKAAFALLVLWIWRSGLAPAPPFAILGLPHQPGANLMSEPLRLTGMPQATPNGISREIRFILTVKDAEPIMCVAGYGVAVQIASGLGTALRILRMDLEQVGVVEQVAIEDLRTVHVQKDLLSDSVVIQMINSLGIPYIFRIPCQNAIDIADRLKIEAATERPIGHA